MAIRLSKLIFLLSLLFAGAILFSPNSYAEESKEECFRRCFSIEERPGECEKVCAGLPPAQAPEGTITNPIAGPLLTPTGERTGVTILESILTAVIRTLIVAAAVFFLFLLLLGGIRWMASGGDKAQIESARSTILNAVVGLVLVFAAFAVIRLLEVVFGIDLLQIDVELIKVK